MYELPRTIPDVKMLLALAPEELASTILFLLKKRKYWATFSVTLPFQPQGTGVQSRYFGNSADISAVRFQPISHCVSTIADASKLEQ